MKKLFLTTTLILLTTIVAFAARTTTYTIADFPTMEVTFNERVMEDETLVYYPAIIRIRGSAYDATHTDSKYVTTITKLGNSSETEYTATQVWNKLPAWAKPLFKDWYTEAIDEDVSQ